MSEQPGTSKEIERAKRRAADQLVRLGERAEHLNKRQRARFARLIAVSTRNYYEGVLRNEAPKLKGKSADEISQMFVQNFGLTPRRGRPRPISVVIDHRSGLLREARRQARRSHREDFALLFYATYFEHWINGIIWTAAKWRNLTDADVTSIIREAPLRAKFTWVIKLLNLPRLTPKHVNKLLAVAENRNAYVHYKWRPVGKNESKSEASLLRDAESAADYLRQFENRVVFLGLKRKVLPNVPALAKRIEQSFDSIIPRLKD